VGERRSIRTIAQRQPSDRGGSRVKQNSKARIKTMAAPAEPRTPNMHRAEMNRSSRVRMEAWRQWSTWREKNLCPAK
jgi:hypothetical protein